MLLNIASVYGHPLGGIFTIAGNNYEPDKIVRKFSYRKLCIVHKNVYIRNRSKIPQILFNRGGGSNGTELQNSVPEATLRSNSFLSSFYICLQIHTNEDFHYRVNHDPIY